MKRTTNSSTVDTGDEFDYEEANVGEPEDMAYIDDLLEHGDLAPGASTPVKNHAKTGRAILLLASLTLVLLVGAAVWLLNGHSSDEARQAYSISGVGGTGLSGLDAGPRVGALAPDFELTDVNSGESVKLSSLRGRPVWLNYFATWCPPCKAELPDIKQTYALYKDSGLVIVGIDMREDPGQVKAFTVNNGYDWTFVVDTDGKVTDRYFVYGIPTHIFIDKEGIIKAVSVGGLTRDMMQQNISMIVGH